MMSLTRCTAATVSLMAWPAWSTQGAINCDIGFHVKNLTASFGDALDQLHFIAGKQLVDIDDDQHAIVETAQAAQEIR
jgi:hypothetical protein